MDSSVVEARIIELLKTQIGVERELTPESIITTDSGLDSVSVMDLVMELEDEFDVTIPLDKLADVSTVRDLAGVVLAMRDN